MAIDRHRSMFRQAPFYRAIAISSLDPRRPEARILLEQHLATAQMQRSGMRSIEA